MAEEPSPMVENPSRRDLFRGVLGRSTALAGEVNGETPPGNEAPVRKMDRRGFLKLASATAVAAGTVLALKDIPQIKGSFDFLTYMGSSLEGNPAQRLGIFQELSKRASDTPTKENKNLLSAWLKLNAAEYYFALKGNFLTAGFIRHFLYGKGETVDISNTFIKNAIKAELDLEEAMEKDWSLKLKEEDWIKMDRDPVRRFFERSINGGLFRWRGKYAKILAPEKADLESLSEGTLLPSVKSLKLIMLTHGERREAEDIHFSLNAYTLIIHGEPIRESIRRKEKLQVRLRQVEISIIDQYNWVYDNKVSGVHQSVMLGRNFLIPFLEGIGVENPTKTIKDLLGRERAYQLMERSFDFGDEEGHLIQTAGYGQTFNVTGRVKLPEVELRIPDKVFERSLNDE